MDHSLPDALAQICAATMAETARRREEKPLPQLKKELAARRDRPRNFGQAIKQAVADGGYGLIAEIKRASPSAGLIRRSFNPSLLAQTYAEAGANCLSVLTDAPHFQGSADDLQAARAEVRLPVLRKDFMLEPWQIYESRLMGADCVLLILAALSDSVARELEDIARALDMAVLAEVHDERELDRALGLQTQLVGVNNRNLKTLQTDLAITERLAPRVPSDRLLVAESGIRTHADVVRLCEAGASCFLVGESLLRQDDVGAATRALLGR